MGGMPVAQPVPPRKLRFSRRWLVLGLSALLGLALLAAAIAFVGPDNHRRRSNALVLRTIT